MATLVIYSDATDGFLNGTDDQGGDYAGARAGTISVLQNTSAATITIGQRFVGGITQYDVYEGFLAFDLSGVDDAATITDVVLSLYGSTDSSTTDFTIQAREYDWGAALTIADFVAGDNLAANTLLATFGTAGFSTAGYNDFTSDAAFLTQLGTALGVDVMRMLLCSSRTVANTTPTGNEHVAVFSADQAGTANDPKLTLTGTGLAAPPRGRGSRYGRNRQAYWLRRWRGGWR